MLELFIKLLQIRALGHQHFIPFFARLAGVQALLCQSARSGERPGFFRLRQQMRGAIYDEGAQIIQSLLTSAATRFQSRHAFLDLQPVAGRAAQRGVHVR